VPSTSFSGITQCVENSDFEDVDEVRRKKRKGTFNRKYDEIYLKSGFILSPGTEQLPKPQCVLCAVVLGNETMKPSRLLRHKELEVLFKSTSASHFWTKVKTKYPKLHVWDVKFLLCFSTTYLCQAAFSAMNLLKNKREEPFAVNKLLTFTCDTTST
jgi:hypothetical protein